MSPNLYDLLDVPEDASADELRTAWKAAIADLEPTDRRFRAFNDAAAVLLDADRRAAYDAELAAARAQEVDEEPGEEPGEEPDEESVGTGQAPAATGAAAASTAPRGGGVDLRKRATDEDPAPEDAPADGAASASAAAAAGRTGPPTWAIAAAAVVAVVAVVLLAVVWSWPGSRGEDPPAEQVEQVSAAEAAGARAEDVAAAVVPEVFSYDYRTLDEDLERARPFLTEDFGAERAALIADIREEVEAEKVVVTAVVSGTGLTRVSPDGDRAEVVVYLEQDSQKGGAAPRTLRMWANLTMVRDGEEWLIGDVCTERDCG